MPQPEWLTNSILGGSAHDLISRLRYGVTEAEKSRMIREGKIPGLPVPERITEVGTPGLMPQDEADRYASAYLFGKKYGPLGQALQHFVADPFDSLLGDREELLQSGHRGMRQAIEEMPKDTTKKEATKYASLFGGRI